MRSGQRAECIASVRCPRLRISVGRHRADLLSDLIDLLSEFENTKVEYLLVGGQAVAIHGFPRFTKDADLWVRDERGNLDRARTALESFGAPVSVITQLESAEPLDVLWMGLPPARIDLMKGVPDGDFERAWATRETLKIRGVTVFVVSRDELIRLKRASGRPQDLVDAENLENASGHEAAPRKLT
jgi:hypothetical protein